MCRPDPKDTCFTAVFCYRGNLPELLKRNYRDEPIIYRFCEHPGVKDSIEAMGIPHTEVDVIVANGTSVGFEYQLKDQDVIEVFPCFTKVAAARVIHLSPMPPKPERFVIDLHLGKLARRLRLLGFDCLYRNDFADDEIMRLACEEERIILTRDRGILKHRKVSNGYLVRSDLVDEQVHEVLTRYALFDCLQPWLRCISCNGLLAKVEKADIQERLEPKTRLYYEDFHRCSDCGQLYWQGSHYKKIKDWLANFRA